MDDRRRDHGAGRSLQGSGDDFLDDLLRWSADARAAEAARSRTQERFLRQAAEEQATFAGVMVDLCERAETVVVSSSSGRSHQGRVVAVGPDFCVVGGEGATVLVALSAVTSIRLLPGRRPGDTTGAPRSHPGASLAAVVAGLAADRPRVQLTTGASAQVLTGELRAAGADVVTLLVPGQPPTTAYVRLDSVTEILLVDRS